MSSKRKPYVISIIIIGVMVACVIISYSQMLFEKTAPNEFFEHNIIIASDGAGLYVISGDSQASVRSMPILIRPSNYHIELFIDPHPTLHGTVIGVDTSEGQENSYLVEVDIMTGVAIRSASSFAWYEGMVLSPSSVLIHASVPMSMEYPSLVGGYYTVTSATEVAMAIPFCGELRKVGVPGTRYAVHEIQIIDESKVVNNFVLLSGWRKQTIYHGDNRLLRLVAIMNCSDSKVTRSGACSLR